MVGALGKDDDACVDESLRLDEPLGAIEGLDLTCDFRAGVGEDFEGGLAGLLDGILLALLDAGVAAGLELVVFESTVLVAVV